MKKLSNQESNRAMALVESKSLRDDTIENVSYDFLDKFKIIPYLTDDMIVTVNQVAKYYEVSKKSVETIISRNRDEFEEDGMVVLKGEEYKDFVKNICDLQSEGDKYYDEEALSTKARSITLLPKRSLLRVGMILTNNYMAKKVRSYLLDVESGAKYDRKAWLIQREVGIIERKRMTSAIAKYIPNTKNKQYAYPNYTNLIYKILFNANAKELKEKYGVSKSELLRDHFDMKDLKKVEEAETIVTGLLSMDFTYGQIKDLLSNRFVKKLKA